MKKRSGDPRRVGALIGCLLLACGFLHAAEAPARPFLWRIDGPDRKPSWIFGTIHLQRPEVTRLPAAVTAALEASAAVYTEIPADPVSLMELLPAMVLPDGQSADRLMGPELSAQVEEEIRRIQPELTLAPLAKLKPWALAAALLQLQDQMKYPAARPLDAVLYQRAAKAGKEVGGIERPQEQLAAFEGFTEAEQISMIRDTVRQLREFRARGESASDFLVRLYLAGDLEALVAELNKLDAGGDDPKLAEKFLDRLLYQRNARMAARIIERLRKHPAKSFFFAIGAAHLEGSTGLLASLEKAGFQLTRLP